MKNEPERFAHLDMGRVLACLLVVVYHAGGTASLDKYFGDHELSQVVALSYVRMPFFFAMSGFLLSWIYLKSDSAASATSFIGKRLVRLFPLYWVVLCAVAALQIFVLRQPDLVPTGARWWATFFLLPQNPVGLEGVGGTGAPVLYPAWVLQYELAAYLLVAFALSSKVLRRAYLFGFPVVYFFLSDSSVFLLSFLGSKWLLIFWCGAFAAWMAARLSETQIRWMRAGAVVWLGWAALIQYASTGGVVTGDPDIDVLYGVGFALLMLGLSTRRQRGTEGTAARWGRRSMQQIALWSYAIFLCHAPVISLVCKLLLAAGFTGELGWSLAVVASLLISVVVGAIAHLTIEEPIHRAIARMTASWRARRQAGRSRTTRDAAPVGARQPRELPPRR